jgi:hypothetical protein
MTARYPVRCIRLPDSRYKLNDNVYFIWYFTGQVRCPAISVCGIPIEDIPGVQCDETLILGVPNRYRWTLGFPVRSGVLSKDFELVVV